MNRRQVSAIISILSVVGMLAAMGMQISDGIDAPGGVGNPERVADGPLSKAVFDMADRTGIEPEVIRLVRVEDATWQDSSLGAPRPGESYAQVVTPGYIIHLANEDMTYVYHTDSSTHAVLVEIHQA